MLLLKLVYVFCFVSSGILVCRSAGKDYGQKEQIIKDFFGISQITIDEDFGDLNLDLYSETVINRMSEAFIGQDSADRDALIHKVNQQIYIDTEVRETSGKYDPMDEHLLDAIDLMLPDCLRYPQFAEAKTDLRDFYLVKRKRAQLLLKWISNRLNSSGGDGDKVILTTKVLVDMLKSYRDRWIPLAQLEAFVAFH